MNGDWRLVIGVDVFYGPSIVDYLISPATVKRHPIFLFKRMVKSSLSNGIVVHRFADPIELQDLMSAKSFVDQHFSETGPGCAVLWDLREASIGLESESMAVFAGFVLNPNTKNHNKRAFLANSETMLNQLNSVLAEKTMAWPWAVFEAADSAMAWLND